MCRLFGFRSRSPAAVHRSLVHADNALRVQSREHPDGWGIGWWPAEGKPQLVRSAGAAHAEAAFVQSAE
jgi:predicted glutamine amidotransferase